MTVPPEIEAHLAAISDWAVQVSPYVVGGADHNVYHGLREIAAAYQLTPEAVDALKGADLAVQEYVAEVKAHGHSDLGPVTAALADLRQTLVSCPFDPAWAAITGYGGL